MKLYKIQRISQLAEELLASQEELGSL